MEMPSRATRRLRSRGDEEEEEEERLPFGSRRHASIQRRSAIPIGRLISHFARLWTRSGL